jgi:CRP/FNR family transcriptional regulator, anaerobic regulatory protein
MPEQNILAPFHFLELSLRQEIISKGRIRHFPAGEDLVREGQFIAGFPLVLHGLIRVTKKNTEGNELLLYYLREKEVCAMSLTCCMTRQVSQVNATAEEPVEAMIIPVEYLDIWMDKYPTWKQFVMQTFQNRFRELVDIVEAIAFMNLDERLIRFFEERFTKTGIKTYEGTHQDLALQLNSSREVISRLLKKLENQGSIKLSRNFIDFTGLV